MFDLSILFEALSFSFPFYFNKDKTESRIESAKPEKHEVFYVERIMKNKVDLLLQPLNLRQYCMFKCILFVVVC